MFENVESVSHLPPLVEDLGLILMAAAAGALLFKKLKQPVVLGYLMAGFLVGPNFNFLPTVKDSASVSIWAEIGVIFMLFGLGLEFSFKKLAKVGKSASITALFEIVCMLMIGYWTGQMLEWSKMDSLFLGGILSISSTTIIVRAFEELGLKGRNFVSLVFGVLIVEDLIAILLLVVLSSVAVTQQLSGEALTLSSLRLGFFLVLWFLLGIYLLPSFMQRIRDQLSDETLLIVSIGLCLMMVTIATHTGFSPALGAFVMGSILAETPKRKRIEHLLLPVKDLFSAVFFVSVGMLINPKVLQTHFGTIILISVITIFAKLMSTTIGALLSGRNIKHSIQAGMSLAQIGEFSFIIATLGMTLKVTSEILYPIAVTVSAITTFATPYLIRFSDKTARVLENRLPVYIKDALVRYETAMSTDSSGNVFSLLWQTHGLKLILNSVIVVAITFFVDQVIWPRLGEAYQTPMMSMVACALTLIVSGPFLWAIFLGHPAPATGRWHPDQIEQLRRLQLGVSAFRFLVGCILTGYVVSHFSSMLAVSGIVLLSLAAAAALLLSRFSEPVYRRIENRFVSNLTENERREIAKKARVPQLAPWDATLMEFVVSAHSPLVLKTLQESHLKEQFGVTITMIERGGKRIFAPKRDDLLYPSDKLFLIGSEDQLAQVRPLLETEPTIDPHPIADHFGLVPYTLNENDRFVNRSIRECGLREAVDGLIVGLEREGHRHLSPDSALELRAGDLIWVVGNKDKILGLR